MKTENEHLFILGITGGIGSGKTSVCKVFEVLGIPVFSADHVAARLMATDTGIINGINSITGKDMYSSGSLDKMQLADLIFNDEILLEKVDHLVHPAVIRNFRQWTMEQTAEYVIMEAAILFESGGSKLVDKTVNVIAPVEERIERVVERSKLPRQKILDRMKNQMNDEERSELSDYVIDNSENAMIIPSILEIHSEILKYLKTQNK